MKKARIYAMAIALTAFLYAPSAAMEPLSTSEMDKISAAGGVSLNLTHFRKYRYDDYVTYHSSDGGSMTINSLLYNDAKDGWFEGDVGGAIFHTKQPVTIDVFNNEHEDDHPMLALQVPEFWQDFFIDAKSLEFDGQEIAAPVSVSYPISESNPSSFALYTTPLNSGIGLQFELGTTIDEINFRYRYEKRWYWTDIEEFLVIGDLHIGKTVDDNGNVTGNFKMGDLNPRGNGEYNPMEVQVASDDRGPFLRLEMPMEGYIRMGEISIDDHNYGPIHIDGIKAHKLTVDLVADRDA